VLDKSAAIRASDLDYEQEFDRLAGRLYLCPMGLLEQLYSAQSARHYDEHGLDLRDEFHLVHAPSDIFDRALKLQRDLAHHHGLWHRVPIPDLVIAETALHHGLGVVTEDKDFERIAKVRGLTVRRLGS
jgi:hypothetical protein